VWEERSIPVGAIERTEDYKFRGGTREGEAENWGTKESINRGGMRCGGVVV